ncbi:alpha/beta fold hydrolase [Allonocardiopsis opalescens]|uniref:Pimeloyl-ACP methyl ester carboxylesterase n=1 Tax=Allonocardiopsis opalescens TaxID=1144618 RepID=A0A2T0Q5A9_9ACTN|nr:alpha/beta fold hydrolase [Allonocardiopsis opalescens]PRX99007.1 pimeloyl-ACP methyl ester carboxylesterase [Allonocardiopsis opalescens]
MREWRLTARYPSGSGEVHWDRFGDPDGEPVVLLHGTPFSSYIWRGTARALARHHRVYVWDMPGYGASEKSAGQDLSLAALGGVFAALLDHWGLERPLVVAHDSGGAVALGAHLLHGVPYRRLALVDAVALSPWGSPFFQLVGEHAEVFRRLPAALHSALLRAYVESASGPGLHPSVLDALVRPWLGADGQDAFYRQVGARLGDQRYTDAMSGRYGGIEPPVLVCWGEADSWIPVDRGRELAARIPGARLRTLPDAGHLAPEDSPAELTALLLAFLRGLD